MRLIDQRRQFLAEAAAPKRLNHLVGIQLLGVLG